MLLIRFNAAKIGIYFKPAYVFTTLNKTFLINLIYIVTHFWYILYRSSRDQEEIKKRSRRDQDFYLQQQNAATKSVEQLHNK